MDKIISCEFNIDTACVEVKYADGSMISIDCTRVENEVARNMYEASELDWLVYNAPVDYVNLLLNGDMQQTSVCTNNRCSNILYSYAVRTNHTCQLFYKPYLHISKQIPQQQHKLLPSPVRQPIKEQSR